MRLVSAPPRGTGSCSALPPLKGDNSSDKIIQASQAICPSPESCTVINNLRRNFVPQLASDLYGNLKRSLAVLSRNQGGGAVFDSGNKSIDLIF